MMDRAKKMLKIVHDALDEKKGEQIRMLDISQISVIADYFVIASGGSRSQMDALTDNVIEQMGLSGFPLKHREGYRNGAWVLLDFGDVIVHVFDRENRMFYNLEHVWSDGKEISAEELQE